MKRFFVNLRGRRSGQIEVDEKTFDRVAANLLRDDCGNMMVEEMIDGGIRRHFFHPQQIASLDEREVADDGWEVL